METSEYVIKQEIEAFLNAPMDIDNSQYEMAVKAEFFNGGDSKMVAVKQECDTQESAPLCNSWSKSGVCQEELGLGSTTGFIKEEVLEEPSPVNLEANDKEWLPPSSLLATEHTDDAGNEDGVGESKQGSVKDWKTQLKKDRHLCLFCETEVTNFARHLTRMHSSEAEVIRLESKPKNSKERRDQLALIRNKGNFLRSTAELCEKPVRKNVRPTSYMPCIYCFGFFSKHLLWKHQKHCPQNAVGKRSRVNKSQNLFLWNMRVDERLKTEVFPRMRADHVSLVAKKDKLICKFAARYLKTHRDKHVINVTSRKMRELAKLLIEVRRLDPSISNLFDVLKPVNYGLLTQATKHVANYSEKYERFHSPTFAINIATTLKDCCNIAILFALQRRYCYATVNAGVAESDLKSLKHLIESNWQYDISSEALNNLNQKKRNKVTTIPLESDLKKVFEKKR